MLSPVRPLMPATPPTPDPESVPHPRLAVAAVVLAALVILSGVGAAVWAAFFLD